MSASVLAMGTELSMAFFEALEVGSEIGVGEEVAGRDAGG
jgi:hypothetical protein